MRLVVSINRKFDDYGKLCSILNSVDFSEIIGLDKNHLPRYAKEFNKAYQQMPILWSDIRGADPDRLQERNGRMINLDAPKEAAQRAAEYGTHILKIDQGDYSINAACEDLEEIAPTSVKRYKF
jgi:hypothetical protein